MDKTEAAMRNLLAALPATGYDLGILGDQGMYRLEAISSPRILRMLPFLKYRNANGAHIYMRPTGESQYTLLDDLTAITLARLPPEGYAPAAVIETSPGSFQAWLRHAQPLPKGLGTLAAQILAHRFSADRSAADWRRFGRVPGFTNRKPQHRNAQGFYPYARLHTHSGQPFAAAAAFHCQLLVSHHTIERERTAQRLSYVGRPAHFTVPVTLSRFRSAPRYRGRPAAADMAFCIATFAQGWSASAIATALSRDYLSRDPSRSRKSAYISRTLDKAIRWAT